MNDETPKDDDKKTQHTAEGEEIEIKDPIHDIMSDKELEVATDRLMSMIEGSDDDDSEDDKNSA